MTQGFGNFGRLKNIANIGDIVVVKGYPGRKFRVESYTHELDFQPDYVDEAIIYDVTDERTGEYLLVFQEEVTVIRRMKKPFNVGDMRVDVGEYLYKGGMSFEKEAEQMSEMRPVEHTKQERIDRLLTEIADYKYLIQIFGDEEGRYQSRIASAKERLKELTGGK